MIEHHDAPTRTQALERLNEFAPLMGSHYAGRRNVDTGIEGRANVSQLSPFIRHRLLSEEEIVSAAVTVHGAEQAFKFIQEICWRTYFKGWLEHRPLVWRDYVDTLTSQASLLEKDASLRADYEAAIAGRTGIDGFDHWARELAETGYLHNHARMSFASIWLFTLKLPWALGADFFLRHLLDGDPASNTLSWRWVAGLHTAGKPYLAKREAIETCSDGRFSPRKLADRPRDIDGTENPPPETITAADPLPQKPFALLLTEDDLSIETWLDEHSDVEAVAGMESASLRCAGEVSEAPRDFTAGALADGLSRAALHFGVPEANLSKQVDPDTALLEWAGQLQVRDIVMPFIPTGWTRDRMAPLLRKLRGEGFAVHEIRRDWDDAFWPHTKKGYFKLRKQIPSVLGTLRVAEGLKIDG